MTRKKVNLDLIPNLSARKASFRKRKSGLLKKVHELSVLCDVETFLIIFSPYDEEPTVWPSCNEVQERLEKYRNRLATHQHTKKMINHQGYLRWRIDKMTDHSKKQAELNKIMEMQSLVCQVSEKPDEIDGLELSEKYTALKVVMDKMKAINIRMNHLQTTSQPPLPSYYYLPTHQTTSQPRGNAIGAVDNISSDFVGGQWMTGMMNNSSNVNGNGLPWGSIPSHDPEIDAGYQNNDEGSYGVTQSNIIGRQLTNQDSNGDNGDENICKAICDPHGSISGTSTRLELLGNGNVVNSNNNNDYYTIGSSGLPYQSYLGEGSTLEANTEEQHGFHGNESNVELQIGANQPWTDFGTH